MTGLHDTDTGVACYSAGVEAARVTYELYVMLHRMYLMRVPLLNEYITMFENVSFSYWYFFFNQELLVD